MQSTINILLDPVVNFGKVTVSTGYSDLDTVIVLTAGHGSKLPNPSIDNPFNLIWYDASQYPDPSDDPNVEIVRCTDNTTDVLTVERAQEGTLASSKNVPTSTYKMILSPTKKTIADIKTEYESGISSGISTHSALDTGVHGVGISTVESIAGSQNRVDTHSILSTGIHGVGGSTVESIAGSQAKVDTHSTLNTGVHGVGISTVESIAGSQAKVDTHAALGTAHGSTSVATANTIIQRDSSGRAQVSAPSVASDIARKDTVDTVQTNLGNHIANITTVHLPSQAGNSGKYLKTDGSVASWQTGDISGVISPEKISKIASANIRNSNDTEVSQQSTSYTLMKTITLTNGLTGTIRVYFDAYNSPSSYNAHVKITHNGTQLVDHTLALGGYSTVAYDITQTFLAGDTIQLWGAQPLSNVYPLYVRNFRLAYDNDPTVASISSNP